MNESLQSMQPDPSHIKAAGGAALPEMWREYRLGALFESRKECGREGLPTFSVTMNDGLIDRNDLERKQDTTLSPVEHLLVEPGDIAYNTMRMWQGAFGRAESSGLVSPAYVVLKPRPEADSAFFEQLFSTPRMVHLFWAYSYGLTDDRLRLYFKDFAAIKVRVPSKSAQRRATRILAAWDRSIRVTTSLAKNADQHCEALTEALVTRVARHRLPPGCQFVQLMDVIDLPEAGVSVNSMDRAAGEGEGGVLKTSAVTSGVFEPRQNKLIRPDELHRAEVNPQSDRIIVSRINTPELVGASAYVERDHPNLFLPDRLWQLHPKSDAVDMRWLAIWLAMKPTRARLSTLATGSSGSMKNISKDQLLSLELVMPPLERQKRIAAEITAWSRAAQNLRLQAEKLSRERSALMQRLLWARPSKNAQEINTETAA